METVESKETSQAKGRIKLPILGESADIDVDAGKEHWRDDNPTTFTGGQRAHTTLLISGLTMAHDLFLQGALRGIGYKVRAIDVPNKRPIR